MILPENSIRICQVASYFPYREYLEGFPVERGYHIGGVERHVYNLSMNLLKLGHKVTIITTKSPNHNNLSDVADMNIIRIPIDFRVYASPISLRILNLNLEEFDVIHAHTPVPLIPNLVAIKNLKVKKPFVLTYHNDVGKEGILGKFISTVYNYSFGNLLLSHSNVIITTTKSYALYSKQLMRYLNKVMVIPNAIDTERFNTKLDKGKIRRKYGINEDDKVILFVGALEPYKGCEYLLSAFSMIAKKVKNVYLMLVGRGSLEPNLNRAIAKLGIERRVFLTNYVKEEELPYYYAACDIFVLPSVSRYEGFGMVQLEAMACGKPVVTTNIPGVMEVDSEGLATIHVLPKDDRALEKAILMLLENESLAIKMGNNGRRLVEKAYSWPKVINSIIKIYRKLIFGQ